MNKTAIKNFAVWARRKLISEITYKAGLIGITEKGISKPLAMSTDNIQFFDIGTGKPTEISDHEIKQREALINRIREKESTSDYKTAFQFVIEEVAYTWFNRLIAIRFMEVNDYLPSRIRVLSSETSGKSEPDMVTAPFDTDMAFSAYEKDRIIQLKHENELDELFRMLFIKQCNKLNEVLPELFEKTADYTELLLTISFTDGDGMVSHLVNDISEDDFKEAVEVIGWMYQYYNTEPKDEVFDLLKKNIKITKERLPAATQLFTPDWIVRYMVENSLGRFWLEGHKNDSLKVEWNYYLEEADQEDDVNRELHRIRTEFKKLSLEDIKVIDPCMGSGHILVYAFELFMQIYETQGYTQKDAARIIIEKNLFGLDIDDRAYQLSYFALMMKARKYDRRFLSRGVTPNIYSIKESNGIYKAHLNYFGTSLSSIERNYSIQQIEYIIGVYQDAKEYGSIINVDQCDWELLDIFINELNFDGQLTLDVVNAQHSQKMLKELILIAKVMARKYDIVVTNPPYMGGSGMNSKLSEFVKKNYPDTKSDLFSCFMQKCFLLAKDVGFVSMITMENWMFLSSFEKIRNEIVYNKNIRNMVHMPYLGKGGTSLGINFGTAAVIFDNFKIQNYKAQYNYIRYYETDEEGLPLVFPTKNERYTTASTDNFSKIPGSPIAYWASEKMFEIFEEPNIEEFVLFRQGMATSDNNRFLRLWHEVSIDKSNFQATDLENAKNSQKKWFAYNKGGAFRKWYGNAEYVVNWENDGSEMKEFTATLTQGMNVRLKSREYYFKECYSWSKITSAQISFRYYPKGFAFDVAGCCVFECGDYLHYFLALSNSKVTKTIAEFLSPTLNFELEHLKKIPLIKNDVLKEKIDRLTQENIEISKKDWDCFETSWEFLKHPFVMGNSLQKSFEIWKEECNDRFYKLKINEEELNKEFINIYGLKDELSAEVDLKDVTIRKASIQRDIISFISYAVGCMFGRYSLDFDGLVYAGGDWDVSKYKKFTPDKDNCVPITDEEYFSDDIVGFFVEFVKCVFGPDTLEENLDFIANALEGKGDTSRAVIRNYFVKDFYKDHVKTYQKRPIYWLYDSGKQDGFKALVYMHRYTADTTGIVRVDYLHKMQKIYMGEIDRMKEMAENSNNAREVAQAEKRREKLIKQLKETKEYDERIAHIALSRIAIDLDDGVKVNYEKVQTGQDGKMFEILAKI